MQHPSVEDTVDINRVRHRPAFAYDRERRLIFFAVTAGMACAAAVLLAPGLRNRFGVTRSRT